MSGLRRDDGGYKLVTNTSYVPARPMRSSGTAGLCIRQKRNSCCRKSFLCSKMHQPPTWWRWCMGSGCIADMRNAPSGLNS